MSGQDIQANAVC